MRFFSKIVLTFNSEVAAEIFLPELLDLYNDLMDIDPKHAENSAALGEAQKNTIFFRDIFDARDLPSGGTDPTVGY